MFNRFSTFAAAGIAAAAIGFGAFAAAGTASAAVFPSGPNGSNHIPITAGDMHQQPAPTHVLPGNKPQGGWK
jgi:hypothetical protein